TPSAWNKAHFWQIYLRCLIALGEEQRAAGRYSALPPGLGSGAVLGPFKMFFDAAQGAHEKQEKAGRGTSAPRATSASMHSRAIRERSGSNTPKIPMPFCSLLRCSTDWIISTGSLLTTERSTSATSSSSTTARPTVQ